MLTADGFAYRPEFQDLAQREGYIFASEQVSDDRPGEPWVLNLRNGAIFNGAGNEAMPWCVSGAAYTWTPVERPPSYDATILGAPGGLEIELACQFDNTYCKRAYDRLSELGNAVHVKLRHIVVRDALYERQVAACAAAIQGRLPRMAALLFVNAAENPDDEDVYVYAEQLGLDMARVDADSRELCPRIIEDDRQALDARARPRIEGVPVAIVDGTLIDGKQISEGALERLVHR